ncbi:unknown protein [Seminavis robusta]|uniref:AB hydrolase-1 domain-containing protein n=1 Tax=Seminavis robusta TaxID=568900 RepID=A0A9N8DKJ3_9STRA|nr:unknown protein [Seminavis robusta]|eukprot:Sro131_g062220.1 n/a (653) ;mRNA; f:39853-41898
MVLTTSGFPSIIGARGFDARTARNATLLFGGALLLEGAFQYAMRAKLSFLQSKNPLEESLKVANVQSLSKRQELWERTMQAVSTNSSVVGYFEDWFFGRSYEELSPDDLQRFIVWCFFDGRKFHQLVEEEEEQLDTFLVDALDRADRELRVKATMKTIADQNYSLRRASSSSKTNSQPLVEQQRISNNQESEFRVGRKQKRVVLFNKAHLEHNHRQKRRSSSTSSTSGLSDDASISCHLLSEEHDQDLESANLSVEPRLTPGPKGRPAEHPKPQKRPRKVRFSPMPSRDTLRASMVRTSGTLRRSIVRTRDTLRASVLQTRDTLKAGVLHTRDTLRASVARTVNLVFQPFGRPTADPLLGIHIAPLYVHIPAVLTTEIGTPLILWSLGFRKHRVGQMTYYYRQGTGKTNETTPLVFIHGIGIGPIAYLPLLLQVLKSDNSRPLLLPEISSVTAFRPWVMPKDCLSSNEVAANMSTMLHNHGFSKATFAGHSFGTFWMSYTVKYAPHLVAGLVFLDPVCFCLYDSLLTKRTVYNPPDTSDVASLVKTDMMVNWSIQRNFSWVEANLFVEDIPESISVAFFLSGDDTVAPSKVQEAYLRGQRDCEVYDLDETANANVFKRRFTVVSFRGYDHGLWLLNPLKTIPPVVEAMERFS